MIAIRREFVVEVPQEAAWQDLIRIERWPSWAKHIKRVEMIPAGELGPKSKGVIHLTNGVKSEFSMTEFNPYRNWKWVGPFFWLTIYYDHVFAPLDPRRTKLIWIVEVKGFGASVLGCLDFVPFTEGMVAFTERSWRTKIDLPPQEAAG